MVNSFLGEFFSGCYEIIDANYDHEKQSNDAFRIKEMGDGFLISIGFPFALERGQNGADMAVEFSNKFLALFESCAKRYSYDDKISCCVGIAYGKVSGYFPKSGPITYDLYGRGIILANRYESLRKSLYENIEYEGTSIILMKKVYEDLSSRYKFNYEEINLKSNRSKC